MKLLGYCVSALMGVGCAPDVPPQVLATSAGPVRVVEVAGPLERPWGMAFLPDGAVLVTERAGRLRLIEGGTLRAAPVAGTPPVLEEGQGGLLDVALDPDFARNRRLYLSYAHEEAGLTTTRVMRARFAPEGLSEQQVILDAKPHVDSRQHFGSRLAFDAEGRLLVTLGERYSARDEAQNLGSHLGKVLRIDTDGKAPPDNPFVGRPGALPEIFTYGHRNPQGLVVDPATGTIWEHEHGAMGGDEINRLEAGANYGWPEVAYGRNYDGSVIGAGVSERAGVSGPAFYWDPSIAPSGLALYDGDRFSAWRGDLLVGALSFRLLSRVDLDPGGRAQGEERLLEGVLGRIRDVRQGPDGLVYLLTDRDAGGLYRLEPAGTP
jgi:glucose/arabinose dehydrogenase